MSEGPELQSEVAELGSRVLPKPLGARLPTAFQLGSTAQAAVPGLYAWFVTVVPCAWGRGGHTLGKMLSLVALLSLAAAVVLEPKKARQARAISVWGLTVSSIGVWALNSTPLEAQHFASARAYSGMLGWGLFAYASAAPALGTRLTAFVEPGLLKPRAKIVKGDLWYLAGGAAAAVLLQTIGWHVLAPERAILIRVTMLAAGLGIIGAAVSLSLARRLPTDHVRPPMSSATIIRFSVVGFGILAAGTLLLLAH